MVIACAGQIASHNLQANAYRLSLQSNVEAYGAFSLTNAALLSTGIPPQGMLPTEPRRKRTLLVRVHDGIWWSEELLKDDPHSYTGVAEQNS